MAYNGFLAFLHGEKTFKFQLRKKTKYIGNMRENVVEAMPPKVILMMPKNQESSKFQRFKNQVFKNQVSRIKIQE